MTKTKIPQGVIFDIKRFALHDGPGIRTTIFLKGCPLKCPWCHNPESIYPQPEMFFSYEKCTGCRTCSEMCNHEAIQFVNGRRLYFSKNCVLCGQCSRQCPTGTLTVSGTVVRADYVLNIIQRDRPFYNKSKGGITISGGEPLFQKEFVLYIIKNLHKQGIHTALDTSAYAKWEDIVELLPYINLIFLDIKFADSTRHKNFTGADNHQIFDNALRLSKTDIEIIVRIPVIPGNNDDEDNLKKIVSLVKTMGKVKLIELLPYNRLAESKYIRLGLNYSLTGLKPPSLKYMKKIEKQLAVSGCPVKTTWGITLSRA